MKRCALQKEKTFSGSYLRELTSQKLLMLALEILSNKSSRGQIVYLEKSPTPHIIE